MSGADCEDIEKWHAKLVSLWPISIKLHWWLPHKNMTKYVSMTTSSRYLASYLVAIHKIQRIAYRRMSKTHILYIFWMLTITLLSVSSKSISNITEKTQDDRIMELENAVRILDNRVQLLNETTHKGMWVLVNIWCLTPLLSLVFNATLKQYFRYMYIA